jgi:polysaccharide biosynthesis protein PslH
LNLERRAVMVCAEAPFPVRGGGALRTASLVHYLAQRYALDVIVFREPNAPDPREAFPAGLARRVSVIELPANRRDPVARALRTVTRWVRRVPPHEDRFRGFPLPLDGRYHLALVEHFWCSSYIEQLRPACERVVLDLHNIESHFYERRAGLETGTLRRIFSGFAEMNLRLEQERLPLFDTLLTTSEADAARITHGRKIVYPNAIPEQPAPRRGDEPVIAFSGNLEFPPNLTAIAWFRDEIWPALVERFPDARWRLIGKNAEFAEEILGGVPNVQFTGPVEDAVAELARCRVAVVPLKNGSGTRLKIIEAWAAGVPVVSTTVGAEGLAITDGEDIRIADGAEAFIEAVTQLFTDSSQADRIARGGRALYESKYTWPSVWRDLSFQFDA